MSSLPPVRALPPHCAIDESVYIPPPLSAMVDDAAVSTPRTQTALDPLSPAASHGADFDGASPVSARFPTAAHSPPSLLGISMLDLLEHDPRPTLVIALPPPAPGDGSQDTDTQTTQTTHAAPVPDLLYCNPALADSPSLRDMAFPAQPHSADLWADISAATVGGQRALNVVRYRGRDWTRSVIGGGELVVISANTPTEPPAEAKASTADATTATTGSFTTSSSPPPPAQRAVIADATPAGPAVTAHHETTALPQKQVPRFHPPTPPTSAVFSLRETSPQAAYKHKPAAADPDAVLDDVAADAILSPAADEREDALFLRQFRASTEFMPVGTCVLDCEGNVKVANNAWHRIVGYPIISHVKTIKIGKFLRCIEDSDQPIILRALAQVGLVPSISFGFRVKKHDLDESLIGHSRSPSAAAPTATAPTDGTRYPASVNLKAPTLTPGPMPSHLPTSAPVPFPSLKSIPHTEPLPGDDFGPEPQTTHVLATLCAEKDNDGRVVRILGCLRDITEEHRSIAAAVDIYAQQASNLRRMTEYATVGLYDIDVDGRLRSANRIFYEMCGLEDAEGTDLSENIIRPWARCVKDEDLHIVTTCLERLIAEGEYQFAEVRFKKPWISDDGAGNRIDAPRWIECTLLPMKNADGEVTSVTGCLVDVSLRKWQLERERQVKEEAIDSRRQQENFVDITSHEIRNPLTVIMHCGDAVLESLTKMRDLAARSIAEPPANENALATAVADAKPQAIETSMVEDAIEYAEIIVGSALHQKAIVDDILTLSKLDSDLLAVTAVTVDPIEIVRSTVRMFEVQARHHRIMLNMVVQPSYSAIHERYFDLDPSRLKQILINLLTNSLKFTRSGDAREVTVSVSASRSRPTDEMCSVAFVPRTEFRNAPHVNRTSTPTKESSVFLIFEVKDTGEGLTKEGRDTLFQKFVQADSTTHIKHGGSGLGLFISKRLAEIQNGAIGVASQPGIGSTFSFYIEAHITPHGIVPEVLTPAEEAKKIIAAGLGASPQKKVEAEFIGPVLSPPQAVIDVAALDVVSASPTEPSGADPDGRDRAASLTDLNSIDASVAALPTTASKDYSLSLDPESQPYDAIREAANAHGKRRLASISATPPEIHGVLLVEDNVVNQKVSRRYFEKCGFMVQVAANGLEAMDRIRHSDRCVPGGFPVSVVLMDMEMPVQGGLECTMNIRALEAAGAFAGGRIPILMITGNARPEQIADARAAGCDDVVVKPFQMQLLYEHIKLIMGTLWEEDQRLLASRGGTGATTPTEEAAPAQGTAP